MLGCESDDLILISYWEDKIGVLGSDGATQELDSKELENNLIYE